MATQIIMIREFLALFHGNELIIGLFLGFWMLLTAAGSFLATKFIPAPRSQFPSSPLPLHRKSTIDNRQSTIDNQQSHILPITQSPNHPIPQPLLYLLALLPLTAIYTLYYFKLYFIPAGKMAGLGDVSLVLLLVLGPFCLVSGMLFPLLVNELSAMKEKNLLHEGYALDSAGSIAGGILFSLVFIFILEPFEGLILLFCICLCLVFARAWINFRRIQLISILTLGIIVMVLSVIFKPDQYFNGLAFQNQEVIEVISSPFGKLAVTEMGGQVNLYENGVRVATGDDPVSREESVHYALLMHPSPETVLLISGGTGGTIEEILKYPVKKIDYLEINPWMISLIGKYRPLPADERVFYIYKDPRLFLGRSENKYDVIILNTPEPNSAELNRFYTLEFFQMLKDKLNPGGIVSLPVAAAGNYMSETSRMIHSVYFNTLQTVFSFVKIIPGGKDYYLASDSSLEKAIFQNYPSLGFTNLYVNPDYINEDLQKMRSDLIMKELIPDALINSDLKPYIFSLSLRHWLSRFSFNYRIIPLAMLLLTILGFIFLGPLNLGLFAGGFTASSLEFLLLIWFQVLYGFVYQMTGVIFAIFMAGLAIGSFYRLQFFKNSTFKGFLTIQAAMAIFSALIAALMLLIPSNSVSWPIILLIMFLVFTTGLLMGIQFSLSGQLRKTSILQSSGESFSADLLGSAVGIGLVSVYLIPQLGLPMTGLVLAGLNVVVMGVIWWKG